MADKTFFIIDGFSYIFRAYYAFINRPLINSRGVNTSAVFGFFNSLLRVLKEYRPDCLTVALESKTPTFRKERYEAYKANRDEAPEDLTAQIPHILAILEAMGVSTVTADGFEADDVVAALADRFKAEYEVRILSPDKDLLQLVGDRVRILRPAHGTTELTLFDEARTREKMGVTPAQVRDYLALVGDTSDNVPGAKGIGPKTAVKLLDRYGSVEGIYARLADITPKGTQSKLETAREMVDLSYELVGVRADAPVPETASVYHAGRYEVEAVQPLLEKLELNRLAQDLRQLYSGDGAEVGPDMTGPSFREEDVDYRLVTSREELRKAVSRCKRAKRFAFDFETTSLDIQSAEIVGAALSPREGEAYYIPLRHDDCKVFADDDVFEDLAPLLDDPGLTLIGHNLKFDLSVLFIRGMEPAVSIFDTMVASSLLTPNTSRNSLDDLCRARFGYRAITYAEVAGKGKDAVTLDRVPALTIKNYACEDADMAFRLYETLAPELKNADLEDYCREIELPLVPVLARMELAGVRIDSDYMDALARRLRERAGTLEGEIHRLAGDEFNVNSTQQLADVLFNRLGIPPVKKTKTGYSTDEEVLQRLAPEHEIAAKVLEYRGLQKKLNTYVEALPKMVHPRTGRIHPSFHQTVTATGRLSCSEPNLQNIPVTDEVGREIRGAFIPHEGNRLYSADYSQIELRIIAGLGEITPLVKAFAAGADIHTETARAVYGVDTVDADMRHRAKTLNYSLVYGKTAYGLSRDLGVTVNEAKEIVDRYFAQIEGMREYLDSLIDAARERGYSLTRRGRRRPIPELASRSHFSREAGKRLAVNSVIQGTAAELIKLAMIAIDRRLRGEMMRSRMVLQVHDELVFEAAPGEEDTLASLVTDEMEHALDVGAPVKVNAGLGGSWKDIH